jgi:hypothetical protein
MPPNQRTGHGCPTARIDECDYLDGHARSVNRPDALLGIYPGGQAFRHIRFEP